MKKTIKLAVVAALALGATSAFATNGSNLIGTGAKARAMGGASIGIAHGAESGLSNPALITTIENTQVSFGGTIFMPDVANDNGLVLPAATATGMTNDSTSAKSKADLSVIPEVSIATKINENFSTGIGMWGTAGMGVDYRDSDNTGQMEMVTNLQLMQFGVPLAYKSGGFSAAITPLLQYGSLDINYNMSSNLQNAMAFMVSDMMDDGVQNNSGTLGTSTTASNVGSGVAQDLKFGYNIGLAYQIDNLTIGAIYKSQIDMEYDGVLSTAAGAMTINPMTGNPMYTNDKLSTPEEYGIGVSYVMGAHTVALDYKKIKWSDAEGYKDFAWDDQNVWAIGYEYLTNNWALRAGYNHASSPISEQDNAAGSNGLTGGIINTFNLLGFPGIVETHVTFGGSYNFSDKLSVDMAYVVALENTEKFTNFVGQDMEVTHSQDSLSLQLNYNF